MFGSSSYASSQPRGGLRVGVPKRCYCGSNIVALISQSDLNPCRRFYRCNYAANTKLMNDDHVFKWVDSALLDEIERLQVKSVRIEKEIEMLTKGSVEYEEMVYDKTLVKIEKEIFDRVGVLLESSWNFKKMMIVTLTGCMVIVTYGYGFRPLSLIPLSNQEEGEGH